MGIRKSFSEGVAHVHRKGLGGGRRELILFNTWIQLENDHGCILLLEMKQFERMGRKTRGVMVKVKKRSENLRQGSCSPLAPPSGRPWSLTKFCTFRGITRPVSLASCIKKGASHFYLYLSVKQPANWQCHRNVKQLAEGNLQAAEYWSQI